MNTGIVKSKASGIALMGKVLVGVMVVGVGVAGGPRLVIAGTQDALFFQYLDNKICQAPVALPGWDMPSISNMCGLVATAIPGGGGAAAINGSANLGTINAGSGTTARKKKGARVPLEEQQEQADKGASADGGGWGLLVAPQYGRSDRPNTELENGYQSRLTGLVVGLDYRSSDRLVLGLALGHTKDKATFEGNTGHLDSTNSTATMYGTWLYSESVAIDGYLGYGSLRLDNQRQVRLTDPTTGVALISGSMSGNTTGKQVLAGFSVSKQMQHGDFSLAPFLNMDYIKTRISGYNEAGSNYNTNLLALHYGDRSVVSMTSSLGMRLGTMQNHHWGALLPSVRLAAVHEFQNKTRQISNELVIAPGASYLVETDAPDRNYLSLGLGVSASLNRGGQLFLDYEKRTQDKLLSSWAVSLGGLFEF